MKSRKPLTPEQLAARDERRAKFKTLWKQVAEMPEAERLALSQRVGIITCDGHPFSLKNSCLLALQNPAGTVFGGFRQWLKHDRAVRKGEHGSTIWIPLAGKESAEPAETTEAMEMRFGTTTVFDISQTEVLPAE